MAGPPPTAPTDLPPTLYLIDGYAQFFRAYHAIRTPMSSPVTREPTNMTFGFVGMLLKLLRGEGNMGGPPAYLAVALDVSGDTETFRSVIDPEYKANRPPPPPDLFPQVDRCLALLEAIGVPTVGIAGFEADDAIATVVTRLRAERPDLRIRIVSKDKDLKQLLVPGRVEMFDVHTDIVIDAANLKAETGLEPRQVIDMLALMGDTVDNVKGVEGIGPKTAAELIGQFGSLDELMKRADEVKGKRGEALRASLDRLPRNVELVALRHDAPVNLDLSRADVNELKLAALIPILREVGFNRYQDDVRALMATRGEVAEVLTDSSASGRSSEGLFTAPQTAAAPAVRRKRRDDDHETASLFGGGGGEGEGRASDDAAPGGEGVGDGFRAGSASGAGVRGDYRLVRTRDELAALVAILRDARLFAIDTETTGLNPRQAKLCGLSFAVAPGAAWYVPVRSPEPETHLDEPAVLAALKPLLEDAPRPKCGHNLKFDMLVLRAAGVHLRGVAFDSMVASYVLDASRSSHGLDSLAQAILNEHMLTLDDVLIGTPGRAGGPGAGGGHDRSFIHAPLALAARYAGADADIALRLRAAMHQDLQAKSLIGLFDDVEMPLVPVLAELEWNGIQVDPAELDRQRARLAERIKVLKDSIDDAAMAALGRTFNPDSPKQLAAALFGKKNAEEPGLGLRVVKRTKTGPSTDIEVLEKLAEDVTISTPIPSLIVDYRQLTKLVSTYLVALKDAIEPSTGRIHASFNQTVAVTGRLASSDPNLQNIPIRSDVGKEIRRAFVAPEGRVFVSADYSQIELRLLAHLSRDPALIEAFSRDEDIHTAVAAQINKIAPMAVTKSQRDGAKMVNFGIVYGITAFGLARRLGIPNDEAAEIINAYKRRFAGITTFLQECVEQARRHGYVETILGRRRPIPEIESPVSARRAFGERTAINSVVQGSAADLIKLTMIDLYARTRDAQPGHPLWGSQMLLQIHDELVFECPAEQAQAARAVIISRMEGALKLSVPLKVESSVAANWYDGK